MASPLYCRPSDLATPTSVTPTAGSVDARYPAAQLIDGFAYKISRATGTSITYQFVFAAPVTLEALACINTNATAIQVTNAAGGSWAIAVPTVPQDGHPLDPWKDLRGLANRTSNTWNVQLTGPTGVGLGEMLFVQTLRTIDLEFSTDKLRESHPTSITPTDYGVRLKYTMSVRQRSRVGAPWGAPADSVMADMLALYRDARGAFKQFLLIPDGAVNDAMFVDLTADLSEFSWPAAGYQTIALEFTEQQKGLAL